MIPLIRHKDVIDNLFTIVSFVMMIWQGLMPMKKLRWYDILIWLFIVNTAFLADYFVQLYWYWGPISLKKF